MDKKYQVIYADPPWLYGSRGAWCDNDEKVFQTGALVRWPDVSEPKLIEAVNTCADGMNAILSKEIKR